MPSVDELPEALDWQVPYEASPDARCVYEGATFWYGDTEYEVLFRDDLLFIFDVTCIVRDGTGQIAERTYLKGGWRHEERAARIAALNCARRAAMGVEEAV